MADYPPPDVPRDVPVAGRRLLAACALGVLVGVVGGLLGPWQAAPLIAWDGAAVAWMATVWVDVLGFDALETSRHATREEPRRALADALLLSASAASLVAIAVVTVKAGSAHGGQRAILVAVSMISVFTSWALVQTVFTLRYAALYYTGPDGGIDFHGDAKPAYDDFAYVAFTIGMTFQVSDTDLTGRSVRRTALRHALLSFVFGAVILAATINLVAGLVR